MRIVAVLLMLLPGPLWAHITEGGQIREILLATTSSETMIYVRTPVPLVFAAEIVAAQAGGRGLQSPFLAVEASDAAVRYRVNVAAIEADPQGFEALLATNLRLLRDGAEVPVIVTGFRLSIQRPGTPFDSAETAMAAVSDDTAELDPVFAQAFVDFALRVTDGGRVDSVQSGVPPLSLPPGISIDNHLTSSDGQSIQTLTVVGQLAAPAAFAPSP